MNSQLVFQCAAVGYISAGIALFLPQAVWLLATLFTLAGLILNLAAVALRYWQAWPMLPMYLSPLAMPLCMAGFSLAEGLGGRGDPGGVQRLHERQLTLAVIILLVILAICFPKDYYLPFLQSKTVFAHLFFLFGVVGKTCFLMGAVKAAVHLIYLRAKEPSDQLQRCEKRSRVWVVWGFAFLTLSMFSGEVWSYLGWGTPVVWEDAAITTMMATWFFYVCLLHLHLTGTWSIRMRTAYTAAGALVVIGLNCFPDLGPARMPF